MEEDMLSNKRRKQLLNLVAERGEVRTQDLVNLLHSSMATLRRDVTWLAAHKLLVRTHGGAMRVPPTGIPMASDGNNFEGKPGRWVAEKRAIAQYAAALCSDGETIVINGGSTTYMMTDYLAQKRMKVLTNSFQVARQLLVNSRSDVTLTGGKVWREQDVILSPFNGDVPNYHYASKIFMGASGIADHGFLETDFRLIHAEKQLIGLAEELIVLADSSKFGQQLGQVICALSCAKTVITDTGVSEAQVQILERNGIRVIVVQPAKESCMQH
jgi:DeoR family transcriptional regulator, ulaG and ulaABCDEF operon transcriptional repressor